MIDLGKYLAAVFVHFVSDQFVAGDAVIGAGIKIIAGGNIIDVGARGFHDDQASPAARAGFMVGGHFLTGRAPLRQNGLVGGGIDAVADFQPPNFMGGEQVFERHGASSRQAHILMYQEGKRNRLYRGCLFSLYAPVCACGEPQHQDTRFSWNRAFVLLGKGLQDS